MKNGVPLDKLRWPILKRVFRTIMPRYLSRIDRLNRDARVAGWIRSNRDAAVLKNRFDLFSYLDANVLTRDEPIDYFEFGVFRGESIRYWTQLNTHPESRFFGFDSFEGLPADWSSSVRSGHFSTGGQLPSIDDPRVTLIKGWFQETLRPLLASFTPRSRLVIHHDSDLYSSVLYCLTQMDYIVAPGTIMIFDEFSDPLHEFRAFEDYCAAYMRHPKTLAMTSAYAEQAAFRIE